MWKKTLATAIGAVTLIGSGIAMAAGPAHPVNDESGSAYHGAEYGKVDGKRVRVDKWNTQATTGTASTSDYNWEFQAGDSGSQLRQHSFDIVKGRLVHTDAFPHDTPRPKVTAAPETFSGDGHSLRPR